MPYRSRRPSGQKRKSMFNARGRFKARRGYTRKKATPLRGKRTNRQMGGFRRPTKIRRLIGLA